MRAIVAHGAGDLRLDSLEAHEPEHDEVVIAMTHAGICGSDLHYYRSGRVGSFHIREPLIVGHEVVGIVVKNPHQLPGFPVGTRVAIHPSYACGVCAECRSDRQHICRHARYLGSAASTPHTQGGMREIMNVPASHLHALPANLGLDLAVLAEPLAVGLHAWKCAGEIAGRRILISGVGPIGLLALRAARNLGATEVWAQDVCTHPLNVALSLGATGVIDLRTDSSPREKFDIVLEASGVSSATSHAIRACVRGGTVIQVGMPAQDPQPYELNELVTREIRLLGTFRFDHEFDEAITMLAGDKKFSEIITASYDISNAVQAFDCAADPTTSSKVVITMDVPESLQVVSSPHECEDSP